MKEKVYNHYVPQFLMRNFSDNGNSIGQYIKNSRSYIKDASIKKICGANYLYGKTSELEDILCDLEGLWAKSIKKICIKEKLPLNKEEKKLIYSFITVSDARTYDMAMRQKKSFNEIIKNDVRYAHLTKTEEFKSIDENRVKIKLNRPNLIPIKYALDIVDILYTKTVLALIINSTSIPFITSDCPVAKYNYLLLDDFCGYGWEQKGLLAFVSVSSKCMLALIDKNTYKINSLNPNKIILHDYESVTELNKLMALQANNFLLFNNSLEKEYLDLISKDKLKDINLDFSHLCVAYCHIKSVKNKINLPFLRLRRKENS